MTTPTTLKGKTECDFEVAATFVQALELVSLYAQRELAQYRSAHDRLQAGQAQDGDSELGEDLETVIEALATTLKVITSFTEEELAHAARHDPRRGMELALNAITIMPLKATSIPSMTSGPSTSPQPPAQEDLPGQYL